MILLLSIAFSFWMQYRNVGSLVIFIFHLCLRHYNPCWNVYTIILKNISHSLGFRSPRPPTPHGKDHFLTIKNFRWYFYFLYLTLQQLLCPLLAYYCYIFKHKVIALFHLWSRWHRCNTTSWRRGNFLITNFYWWFIFTIKSFSSEGATISAIEIIAIPSYFSERVIYLFSAIAAAIAEISPAVGTPPPLLVFFVDSNLSFWFYGTVATSISAIPLDGVPPSSF